ncbi:Neuroblast differentiation-associated protein [Mucor velutinosus]|uniref:Neuroblast differentiation-associated protein n=1 Tax=Mucor velutinosus TaxID=708070 RepID=A0AAN7HLP1_9FUNG|nr:Neuroblast differentiation-associated protein [Mucor velutinosus]
MKVHPETVRKALHTAGLGAVEKEKKFLLSHANKRAIWTDKTNINRFNSDGRQWAWIRSGEQLQNHHVKLTVKHGGGSITLWSVITYAGVGWKCMINGNMDKALYKKILQDESEQTITFSIEKLGFRREQQVIFQQDNDPKHTSNLVKDYLQEQSYQVMEWPPQPPNFNPIENMSALLKRRLNE